MMGYADISSTPSEGPKLFIQCRVYQHSPDVLSNSVTSPMESVIMELLSKSNSKTSSAPRKDKSSLEYVIDLLDYKKPLT